MIPPQRPEYRCGDGQPGPRRHGRTAVPALSSASSNGCSCASSSSVTRPENTALVETLEMHTVEMPDQNRCSRQQRLCAVGRLGGRNHFAGKELGRRDRIPQDKPGQSHHDGSPDERPVLGFLAKGKAPLAAVLAEPQVVKKSLHYSLQASCTPGSMFSLERRTNCDIRPQPDDRLSPLP